MTDNARGNMGGRILVFDSGIGGLSVLGALEETCRGADFVFAADNAAFPFGSWPEDALRDRLVSVLGALLERYLPDLVVIACNSASTLALKALRTAFDVPFVGTVPAIRVASRASTSRMIGILATPGTVQRGYTRDLIRDFAVDCDIALCGCEQLAQIAEAKLARGTIPDPDVIRREIGAAFAEKQNRKTDIVVLACTHYPFLLEEIAASAPWPVTYIDPADAIARRTADVLGSLDLPAAVSSVPVSRVSVLTRPVETTAGLARTFSSFGLTKTEVLEVGEARRV